MLGCVFRFRVVSGERTGSGKGDKAPTVCTGIFRYWGPLVGRLEDKTETYKKGKMISYNTNS